MNMRSLLILFIASIIYIPASFAQEKAKAISYALDIYLEVYDPVYYENTESDDVVCHFEVDTYYNDMQLKTVTRKLSAPIDYQIDFLQLFYDLKGKGQYHVDHANKAAYFVAGQPVQMKSTGRKKEILGYKCREYIFSDSEGTYVSLWVTEKLAQNICPIGNFILKGTVLEMLTSNGIHCKATDVAAGDVDNDFFTLPEDYTVKTMQQEQL